MASEYDHKTDFKVDARRSSTSSRPSLSIDTKASPSSLKKRHTMTTPALEAVDSEYSEKADRPPRFSTLFGKREPDPVQTPQLPPRSSRPGRGIFVPTPVFVLLVVTMLFEGLGLFAYTAIGLFNNLSPQGFHHKKEMCDCNTHPPINIAPNFVWGNGMNPPGLTIPIPGIAEAPVASPAAQTTPTIAVSQVLTTSLTTSSSTVNATAAASRLLGIFNAINKSSSTSSATPTESTVEAVTVVTVGPSGSSVLPVNTVISKVVVTAAPKVITVSP